MPFLVDAVVIVADVQRALSGHAFVAGWLYEVGEAVCNLLVEMRLAEPASHRLMDCFHLAVRIGQPH